MVKQRHQNCKDAECEICFEDAKLLEQAVKERMGNLCTDYLVEYRKFLDDHDIPTETEHGWPTAECFDERNLNAFAAGCPSLHWSDEQQSLHRAWKDRRCD